MNKTNGVKLLAAVLALSMICVGVAIVSSDDGIDAASTDISYISGTITPNTEPQEYLVGSIVVVNDDLSIPDGATLIIGGQFTLDSGCEIEIQEGGQLIFLTTAYATINGDIVAIGNDGDPAIINNSTYNNDTNNRSGLIVNGSIVLEETIITADNVNNPADTAPTAGEILIRNGANVDVGGSEITKQTILLDNGATFVYNGTTDQTGITVTPSASGDVYSAGSVTITGPVTYPEDGDLSELTFTVSVRNINGYTWNTDRAETQVIRQYSIGISGYLDNQEKMTVSGGEVQKSDSSEITLADRYFTTAEYAEAYNGLTVTTYKYDAIVKGNVSVGNLTVGNGASVDNSAYVTVSGIVNFAEANATAGTADADITNSGTIVVSGTINMNASSLQGGNGTIAIDGGVVNVANGNTSMQQFLYGASYVGTDSNRTMHIMDLDDAIAAAQEEGVTTVYVAASYDTDNDSKKIGGYTVSADLTIPDDMTLRVFDGLVISEGVTFTIAADGGIRDQNAMMIFVDGVLVDNSRDLERLEATNMQFEVKIVNGEGRERVNTYTTLAYALTQVSEGTIYLYGDVNIKGTVTIPENVTVEYSEDAIDTSASITLEDRATLVVNGALNLTGSHALDASTNDDATVTVNNIIRTSAEATNISGEIAGAHFNAQLDGDEEPYDYITSVAYAAANSASVEDTDGIDIVGNVAMGEVTFTAGENGLKITVTNDGDTGGNQSATGDVTLSGAVIFDTASGIFTGSVTVPATAEDVVFDLDGVYGAKVESVYQDVTDGTETTAEFAPSASATPVNGTITISTGVATFVDGGSVEKIVVAEGATLEVGANLTTLTDADYRYNLILNTLPLTTQATMSGMAGLVVNGTVNLTDNYKLEAYIAYVDGTINAERGTLKLDISLMDGSVTVGNNATATMDTAAVNGTVSGIVGTYYIVAGTTADLENAEIRDMTRTTEVGSTALYVNGEAVGAIYGMDTVPVELALLSIDVSGVEYNTAKLYVDEGMTNCVSDLSKSDNEVTYAKLTDIITAFRNIPTKGYAGVLTSVSSLLNKGVGIGEYDAIYIGMDAAEVDGSVSEGTGLNLYIDNVAFTPKPGSEGTINYTLTVGTHTVRFDTETGYDGSNATITFNGQTVQNGGTITITADMTTFTLVASGAVPSSGQTVVVDGGSSDGLGLTDYLLIILVILIVVMAIMVALRLMRS